MKEKINSILQIKGIKPLDENEKLLLVKQREEYKRVRERIEISIKEHKDIIYGLEMKIEDSMPKINGTGYVHDSCELMSAIHVRNTSYERYAVYYCLFCDKVYDKKL